MSNNTQTTSELISAILEAIIEVMEEASGGVHVPVADVRWKPDLANMAVVLLKDALHFAYDPDGAA